MSEYQFEYHDQLGRICCGTNDVDADLCPRCAPIHAAVVSHVPAISFVSRHNSVDAAPSLFDAIVSERRGGVAQLRVGLASPSKSSSPHLVDPPPSLAAALIAASQKANQK